MKQRNKDSEQQTKTMSKVVTFILFFFSFVFILLALSARWGSATWGNLSMDELIFTLSQSLTGTGQGMIGKYIFHTIVPTIFLLIGALAIYFLAKRNNWERRFLQGLFLVSTILVVYYGGGFIHKVDAINYFLEQNQKSNFIEANYVDPAKTKLTFPKKKRNLIYIYLESMEMTSTSKANGGNFNKDLIPELTKLSQENENFSGSSKKLDGGYSLPGSTWTMGGIFAQSSGLPLKTNIGQNSMSTQSTFFPNITTLGDILAKEGYNQTFMLGSNTSFAGRRTFFKDHGDFDIEDYPAAKKENLIGKNYKVFWGYEDSKLFSFSKRQLNKIAAGSKPFNFTMLTVDTHFPEGYKDLNYQNKFNDQYLNVMNASSRQVADFISWIQKQPWYKNTTIVINGDHPTMSQSYTKKVNPNYTRKTYTAYINAAVKRQTKGRRTYSTMDNFPTTLAALGVKIKGNRLGLGTNLFSETPTLSERYGYAKQTRELKRTSKYLNQLEKMTDVEAAKEMFYEKAKNKGKHKAELKITKVKGKKLQVTFYDFRHDKKIVTMYLKASTNKLIKKPLIVAKMHLVEKKPLLYKGTIDVSDLKSKKFYLEVSYNDPEAINYPLGRKYVDLDKLTVKN